MESVPGADERVVIISAPDDPAQERNAAEVGSLRLTCAYLSSLRACLPPGFLMAAAAALGSAGC